jgi:secreted trypsin-like serine protease
LYRDNRLTFEIISAAHCFDEFVFRARLTADGESREVVRVVYHPEAQFSENRFEHDIAVAELDSPLPFAVTSVTLAPQPQVGQPIYIFGYGRTTASSDIDVGNEELFGGMMTVSKSDDLFFDALYDGRSANTCRGDSGGPAYSFDAVSGRLQLSGLVSSGTIESCTIGDVTVFTNLANQSNRAFLLRETPEISLSVD